MVTRNIVPSKKERIELLQMTLKKRLITSCSQNCEKMIPSQRAFAHVLLNAGHLREEYSSIRQTLTQELPRELLCII